MLYLKELKQKAKLGRNEPKCTLEPKKFGKGCPLSQTFPHLALRANMGVLPPSLVPAIDTFVPATLNLNKNPGYSP